jgi:hypothetical protein
MLIAPALLTDDIADRVYEEKMTVDAAREKMILKIIVST